MEQAIEAESYHAWPHNKIETGDVDSVMKSWDPELIVEGSMRTGAQEHFYLETHATIAIPSGEDDEMRIIASTQNPTATQNVVAGVLGVQANKVINQSIKVYSASFDLLNTPTDDIIMKFIQGDCQCQEDGRRVWWQRVPLCPLVSSGGCSRSQDWQTCEDHAGQG